MSEVILICVLSRACTNLFHVCTLYNDEVAQLAQLRLFSCVTTMCSADIQRILELIREMLNACHILSSWAASASFFRGEPNPTFVSRDPWIFLFLVQLSRVWVQRRPCQPHRMAASIRALSRNLGIFTIVDNDILIIMRHWIVQIFHMIYWLLNMCHAWQIVTREAEQLASI